MVTFVDTNIIIRFLTNDVPRQTRQIQTIIGDATANGLIITDAVLSGACYVLEFNPAYRLGRELVAKAVSSLFEEIAFAITPVAKQAIVFFRAHPKLDFVDCLLLAQARLHKDKILTFDKHLQKILAT